MFIQNGGNPLLVCTGPPKGHRCHFRQPIPMLRNTYIYTYIYIYICGLDLSNKSRSFPRRFTLNHQDRGSTNSKKRRSRICGVGKTFPGLSMGLGSRKRVSDGCVLTEPLKSSREKNGETTDFASPGCLLVVWHSAYVAGRGLLPIPRS